MTGKDLARLGCALFVGMALAFPVGLMVAGGGGKADRPAPRNTTLPEHRDMFSPRVFDDPYVLEQQRRNVAALEAHCRDTGELCPEAGQARRWLDEQD